MAFHLLSSSFFHHQILPRYIVCLAGVTDKHLNSHNPALTCTTPHPCSRHRLLFCGGAQQSDHAKKALLLQRVRKNRDIIMAENLAMDTDPEPQFLVPPPIDSSGRTDFLPGTGSGGRNMEIIVTLEEGQLSSQLAHRGASGVIRTSTPIPFRDGHPVQQLSTASSPFSMLNLETSSSSASGTAEMSGSSMTEEERDSGSATTGLERAYSTVLESANIPIGHQSSRSLRHVVLSRTTSQSEGNVNSSQESFVQIFNFEPDPFDTEHPSRGELNPPVNDRKSAF